jgi:chitinase
MGKPSAGGSPDMSWEKGIVDYKSLPLPGATGYLDPESKGAYSYDPAKRVLNTYDNRESIIEKCRIIYEKNLGGMLIWENSADKNFSDPRSLVSAIKTNLTHGRPSNTQAPTPTPTPVPVSLTIDSNGSLIAPKPTVTTGPKFKVSFTIDSNGTITGLQSKLS